MAESGLQLSKAPASREACSTPSATSMPIGSGSMCGAESFEAVKDDICSIAKWVQDTQLLHESQVTPRGLRLPGSVGGTMDPSKGSSFADPMSPVEGFFDTISSTGSGTGSDAYFGLSSLALRRGSEVSSIVSPCVDQLRAVLDKTPAGGFFIEHTAIRFHSPGQEHTPFASYMGNSAARPLTSTCTIETNSLREHEAAAAKCVWRPSMTGKVGTCWSRLAHGFSFESDWITVVAGSRLSVETCWLSLFISSFCFSADAPLSPYCRCPLTTFSRPSPSAVECPNTIQTWLPSSV